MSSRIGVEATYSQLCELTCFLVHKDVYEVIVMDLATVIFAIIVGLILFILFGSKEGHPTPAQPGESSPSRPNQRNHNRAPKKPFVANRDQYKNLDEVAQALVRLFLFNPHPNIVLND
jgi:hypothetical protein